MGRATRRGRQIGRSAGRWVGDRSRRLAGDAFRWTVEQGSDWAAADHKSRLARRFGRFGPDSIVTFPRGAVYGEAYIHLGANTLIAPHVTLAVGIVPDQVMATDPVIRIGDGCLIGRGSAIVGHYGIDIGDDVFFGMNVYVTDQNHAYEHLDDPIGRQEPIEDRVRIGEGTWVGAGVVILPGADIGRHVVVAANAVVRGTVPDHSVVAGVPARVVRQHRNGAWESVSGTRADTDQPRSVSNTSK
ncbi:MAG: acyltransferase [Actinomycetota bacterium]